MFKSYIKAAIVVISVIAAIYLISAYDGEKFTVPIIEYLESETVTIPEDIWEENESDTITGSTVVTSCSETQTEILPTEEIKTETAAISYDTEPVLSETAGQKEGLININSATAGELTQLPGIGDVIAGRIIEYAKTNGFNSIEEIKNVKGIGDKKYEKIKDKITV